MKHITLPDSNAPRRLSFFLAMEEYVARHMKDVDDAFFMWRVEPSVIFGRNQVMENEVNVDYCRSHNIQLFRRKSGGGCVYADMGNIMLSYITNSDSVALTYNRYLNMVLLVLHKMGLEAHPSGRNDITLNGKKISGNAFYLLQDRSIVHGTLLYDIDMENMLASITPSKEKLRKNGVESVRQRITLLREYTSLTIEEVMQAFVKTLCHEERQLTAEEVATIEEMETEYLTDEFINRQ